MRSMGHAILFPAQMDEVNIGERLQRNLMRYLKDYQQKKW
jgi:hypothetical protein